MQPSKLFSGLSLLSFLLIAISVDGFAYDSGPPSIVSHFSSYERHATLADIDISTYADVQIAEQIVAPVVQQVGVSRFIHSYLIGVKNNSRTRQTLNNGPPVARAIVAASGDRQPLRE